MKTKKKSSVGSNDSSAEEAAEREFGISIEELKTLMQTRGHEGIRQLNETYGGINGLEQKLKTNLITGLSDNKSDFSKRINAFGRNQIPSKPPKTFVRLLLDALQNVGFIKVIIFAIILFTLSFYPQSGQTFETEASSKFANAEWIEGIAIIIALVVVVLITAFNDLKNEQQFRDSQSKMELDQKFDVIRENTVQQISIKDIVVGDICQIKSKDVLPVDGIVVQSNGLKLDESSLTGETDLIKKYESEDPFLLSGSNIMEGNGKMLVLAVGEHSQMGMICQLLGTIEKQNAPELQEVRPDDVNQGNNEDDGDISKFEKRLTLHDKLKELIRRITHAGKRVFILIVLVLLIPFVIEEFVQRREWNIKFFIRVIRYLITGTIVYTVSVPENLLLAATVSLAYTVKKMMIDNILVRHLDAVETIGNVTTICCDQTGVLTMNRLTVVQIYVGEEYRQNVENCKGMILPANTKEVIIEGFSVNTSYSSKLLSSTPVGNKTDCSLLEFVSILDGNYDEIRRRYPEENFVHVYPFNSIRKTMSTVIQRADSAVRMYTKGASEIVLKKCKTILNQNGEVIPFSTLEYDRFLQTVIEPMGSDGLRTICLAYRDFSSSKLPDWNDETSVIDQLTCICICGIEDPVRPEVPQAISKCQMAGITVRMVTGDNINKAQSIALKCGIISSNDNNVLVLEGQQFHRCIRSTPVGEVEQDLFDKVWPNLRVLARSSPQNKYELVRGIMASKINLLREAVAVTGDGTNDVPTLKKADVAFAMGIQGTDAAKEASDIIVVDDNFNSIVKAIMWGRNDSILKSLQFHLIVNAVIVLCAFIGAFTIKDSLLRDIQMLWIYLTMNILATLALAIEAPTEELLKSKPSRHMQPLISRTIMKNIVGQTIYQLTVMLFILFAGPQVFNIDDGRPVDGVFKPSKHFTMIFNVFVLMNLFNQLNCRKIQGEKNIFRGISRNPFFNGIWISTFVLQILLIQYGSFGSSCVPLTCEQWMWCLLFGLAVLIWNQMLNLIPLPPHMSKSYGSRAYELPSSIDLDLREQSTLEVSPTKRQIL